MPRSSHGPSLTFCPCTRGFTEEVSNHPPSWKNFPWVNTTRLTVTAFGEVRQYQSSLCLVPSKVTTYDSPTLSQIEPAAFPGRERPSTAPAKSGVGVAVNSDGRFIHTQRRDPSAPAT